MDTATKRPKPSRNRRYALGCLTPLVLVLIAVLIRWQTQNVPDRPILPPLPPLPHPNAADTFTNAANQCAQNGGLRKFLGREAINTASIEMLRNLVRANRNTLATFRKGLEQPCQYPYPPQEGHFIDPNWMKAANLAEVLQAEGLVHEEDHQWRAAADSYLDAYEYGTRVSDNKMLVNTLAGALMESIGMEFLDRLLDECDAATAAHIESRLQSLLSRVLPIADAFSTEALCNRALIQRWGAGESKHTLMQLAVSDPNWHTERGWQILDTLLKVYYRLNKRDILVEQSRYWGAQVADIRRPYYQRRYLVASHPPMPRDLINFPLAPLYLSATTDAERKRAKAKLLIIEAALKVYATQHGGTYPKMLVALHLKPSLLADPFRNAPMVYIPLKDEDGRATDFKLYSVGENGKDDGGDGGENGLDILAGDS